MQIWVLVAAIVINLSLAIIILTQVNRTTSTTYFALSSLFVGLWAGGTLLMLYGPTSDLAYFGLVVFLLSPMATTLFMVLFSKQFTELETRKLTTVVGFSSFMLVVATIVILFIDPVIDIMTIATADMISNSINFQKPWFILYGLYFVVMFSIAYGYLLYGYIRRKGKLHQQLRLVFPGILLTSSIALVTNVVLPLLGNSEYLWIGPAASVFYIVTTSFAIIRYGLFDVRLALAFTFTYVLSLTALSAIYLYFIFIISGIFLNTSFVSENNIINIAMAIALAFLFQPIRRFFDRLTSRIFYQNSYDTDEFFASISQTLNSTTDLQQLLRIAARQIADTFKSSNATFLVFETPSKFIQKGIYESPGLPAVDIKMIQQKLKDIDEYPIIAPSVMRNDRQLWRLMHSHKIAIILPLYSNIQLIGFLFLGEHRKNKYTSRDMRVLKSISGELVIAIQNALSVEKLKVLNETLQQRIDEATSELRASNAQLQRLDEAKDEFISMASHQLRTPLTSIKGYISMMMEGDAGKISDAQHHFLEEAFMSSERMVRLINDFLNVSRLQTGKFTIEKRPTDLRKIVQQELDGLKISAAARGLQFSFKPTKSFPSMDIDESKIRQVIMNFADNAVYYSKEGTSIVVSLKADKAAVTFTVTDTGIGVPVEEQASLFNKFFRATNARKQRPDGTGIGLFLAKKVIDAHHGKVLFESTVGKGSTFGFSLPIKKATVRSAVKTEKLDR